MKTTVYRRTSIRLKQAVRGHERLARTILAISFLLAYCIATDGAHHPAAPRTVLQEAVIAGLDHIPIAVTDLDRAAQRYRELGFALKQGTPHANGIRNQHVKFPDGTELELITAPEERDSLTTKYRRHLRAGDGPAFLAFYAPALDRVEEGLAATKVGYRRNPGYLAIADPHPLDYIFFGGRNRSPTDRPEHFAHENGAESLIEVWLAGDDLSHERAMLEALGAALTVTEVHVPDRVKAEVAHLSEGAVVFLPGTRQLVPGRRIVGAALRVASLARVRKVLGVVAQASPSTATSVFLPPTSTHGLWLEFREAR
jgi:catechol 2,3-dioxygenase-like lactoylglutathione lyase family enzyme